MRLKKLLCLLVSVLLCLSGAAAQDASAQDKPYSPCTSETLAAMALSNPTTALAAGAPTLGSVSAALLCAENGQFLLEKGGDQKLAPASITKLMTALVVLENASDLSVTATASETAVHSIEPGSTHVAIDTGEVLTLHDLMGAMLVESANDASNVLAEHVGGSLEGFANKMNEKAAALGCSNTHFVNANGLDNAAHYTTAHDMALIAQALTAYPAFFEFAGARSFFIEPTNKQAERREFGTKQNFLNPSSQWYDKDVLGGKNGWTTNAHHTLVTFKRVDDVTLIAVVMCETSKQQALTDTAALFRYGYDQYHAVTLSAQAQSETALTTYPNANIDALHDTIALLPKGDKAKSLALACTGTADAPALTVSDGNAPLFTLPLALLSEGAPSGSATDGERTTVSEQDAHKGLSPFALGSIAVGAAVLLSLTGLLLYRWHRVRRQRRRIRAMRGRR